MFSTRISPLIIGVVTFLIHTSCTAEFLKTGTGVYQSSGKRAKVIISQEQPGIFVLNGPESDIQTFNPSELKEHIAIAHAFLKFDPQLNKYTALYVGKHEFRIAGSFTLLLGDMRVTVDNSNPYCSIVLDAPGGKGVEPEILGLLGLSVIVNNTGQQAVALLEANQLSQYKGVVNPYVIQDGKILVNNKPVSSTAIGVVLEQKNPCLNDGVVILSRKELSRLETTKDRNQVRELLAASLNTAKKKSPLRGLLKLRISPESIIALDPIKGSVKVIKKVTFSGGDNTVCGMDEVKF